MGQSTDAILVWGYELDEVEKDMGEIRETLYERKGLVQLVRHCSGDYPMWILGIGETKMLAWRGSPQKIDPESLTTAPSWTALLGVVAQEFDLEVSEDRLAWWLASDWS